MAALAIPWIVFDTRKSLPLWISTLLGLFCLISIHSSQAFIPSDINTHTVTRQGLDFYLLLTSAFILLFGLYMLQSSNLSSEKENQAILNEIHARERLAKENEVKMNDYIAQIEKTREEDKKRQWTSDGLAKFTDLLRSHDNVKQFGDNIIAQLVKYVNTNQGGLFILREAAGESYMELVACYATAKNICKRRLL